MRTLVIGLTTALAVVIGWSIVMATDKPPRQLGPEWKKDGTLMRRKMEIPLARQASGRPEWTIYTVEMENNTVQITENDTNGGVGVSSAPIKDLSAEYMSVASRMNEEGKVREFTLHLKDNVYFDLDGDGMIDAFYDKRGKDCTPMVIFEGRFVQVEDFKSSFAASKGEKVTMWGIGRTVQYVFDKGVWNEVPVK